MWKDLVQLCQLKHLQKSWQGYSSFPSGKSAGIGMADDPGNFFSGIAAEPPVYF